MPDEAFLLGMPGRLRDGPMTVKVVTVFESNLEPTSDPPGHDRPLRPEHRRLPGVHGRHVHHRDPHERGRRRRHATCSPARDARVLAIIGAGVQGEHHLRTFPLVREFDEIRISSLYAEDAAPPRRAAPARARGRRSRGRRPRRRRGRARHPRRAARHRRRTGSRPARTSARSATARPTASCRASCSHRAACSWRRREAFEPTAGRLRGARRPRPATATEIGEVLLARAPGRTSDDEITVYKAMGHVVEDIVAAELVYAPRCAGTGVKISL